MPQEPEFAHVARGGDGGQLALGAAAYGVGVVRDVTGSYDDAWYGAAVLCVIAAGLSLSIRRRPPAPGVEAGDPTLAAAQDAVTRG